MDESTVPGVWKTTLRLENSLGGVTGLRSWYMSGYGLLQGKDTDKISKEKGHMRPSLGEARHKLPNVVPQ